MKKVVRSFAIAIAFVTTSVATLAADLRLPPAYQPPPIFVLVYNWTGIYVGVNGGYGFGQQTPGSLFGGSFSAFNYNANGWLGGGTVGAQIKSGHTVIGLEGDIDRARINASGAGPVAFNGFQIGTATLSSSLSSISTLRTRVG